MEASLTSDPK